MAPKDEIDVKRQSLLDQARTWTDQGRVIGAISTATKSLEMHGYSGGAFEKSVRLYTQRTQEVGYYTWEGRREMLNITTALCTAAKNYKATEQQITDATRGDVHIN